MLSTMDRKQVGIAAGSNNRGQDMPVGWQQLVVAQQRPVHFVLTFELNFSILNCRLLQHTVVPFKRNKSEI